MKRLNSRNKFALRYAGFTYRGAFFLFDYKDLNLLHYNTSGKAGPVFDTQRQQPIITLDDILDLRHVEGGNRVEYMKSLCSALDTFV